MPTPAGSAVGSTRPLRVRAIPTHRCGRVALGPGSAALRADAPSVAARSLERFDFRSPRRVDDDAFSDLWRSATADPDGPLAAALAASVGSSIDAETRLAQLDARRGARAPIRGRRRRRRRGR